MESYNWPGNVRELENTIQRATVLANTDVLTSRDIPLGLGIAPRPETATPSGSLTNEAAIAHLLDAAINLNESPVAWIERQLAEEALRRENQDHTSAARRLGLKPTAFKKLLGPEA
jgi:DNA-binding NtrC family response regulator